MVLVLIAFCWLACTALAAGFLHHAPVPARLLALLGPLALLYLLGVYLTPIDPTPGGGRE
jgi:hypothetical protein